MDVTGWGKAVRAVLSGAGISERKLAKRAHFSPMAVNRYLRSERRPDPDTVLNLNKAAKELVSGKERIPGNMDVLVYLTVEAALAGLLDRHAFESQAALSLSTVLDGAILALETLGPGILRTDWLKRLIAIAETAVDRPARLTHFLVALNREHGRLLLEAIGKPVPANRGYVALRDVLSQHGLTELLQDDTGPADAYQQLTRDIRLVLTTIAADNVTARERFDAERRLLRSALTFVDRTKPPSASSSGAYSAALADMMASLSPKPKRPKKGKK